jgi:IS5 family transposase
MAQKVFKVGHYHLAKTNLLLFHEPLLHEKFLQTDLGKLYQAIPFEQLSSIIASPAAGKSGLGCKPWFDVKGGVGLQFLKHYLQLSDALLIERINTDWSMQLFCGILLKP